MAPTTPSLHGLSRFFGGLARALVAAVALLGAWLVPAGCDSNPTPHPERPDTYRGDDKATPGDEPNEGFLDDGRDDTDGDPAAGEADATSSDTVAGDAADGGSASPEDDAGDDETADQGEAGFADPPAPCGDDRSGDSELRRDDGQPEE